MRALTALAHRLRRFAAQRDGGTLIEFAFVAPMVIAGVCGVMFLGLYLFTVNQTEEAARLVAREVMLIAEPDEETLNAALAGVMDQFDLPNEEASIEMVEEEDGRLLAMIRIAMEMDGTNAFLDTDTFRHEMTLYTPLFVY